MNIPLIIKPGGSLSKLVSKRGDFNDWILSGIGINQNQDQIVSVDQ
jgi:hypothetical protein